MHIVVQEIIREYKQNLRIYFDNVCAKRPIIFFIVSPTGIVPFCVDFLLFLL